MKIWSAPAVVEVSVALEVTAYAGTEEVTF
jgi:coenzyme PQQ precursor peptide PqqA